MKGILILYALGQMQTIWCHKKDEFHRNLLRNQDIIEYLCIGKQHFVFQRKVQSCYE